MLLGPSHIGGLKSQNPKGWLNVKLSLNFGLGWNLSLKIGFQNHVDIKEKEKQAAAVINKRKKTRERRENNGRLLNLVVRVSIFD